MELGLDRLQSSAKMQLQRLEELENTKLISENSTPRNDIERYFNQPNKKNNTNSFSYNKNSTTDKYDSKIVDPYRSLPESRKLNNKKPVVNNDKLEYMINKIDLLENKVLKLQAENLVLSQQIKSPQNGNLVYESNRNIETQVNELKYYVEKLIEKELVNSGKIADIR
jgi:flagellar biosynthesis GTPase FlhF